MTDHTKEPPEYVSNATNEEHKVTSVALSAEEDTENPLSDEETATTGDDSGTTGVSAAENLSGNEETSDAGAKTAEKQSADYSSYSRNAMVECLRKLIEQGGNADAVKNEVNAIKFHFYRKLKIEQEQEHRKHVENGGTADNYTYEEDAQELILKTLLNKYREIRDVQREQEDVEKQKNLAEKLKIIDDLKKLTASGNDSIGENFQAFRDLQNRWSSIGMVAQSEMKNLWDTYHHYVEVFYDFIRINKGLRDLDFKRNLEAKTALCEKTEALLEEPLVVNAFHALQTYHEQWREIGTVPKEVREEIWKRFKTASSKINKKHQEYFDALKESRKNNLEAKEELCRKMEEILQQQPTSMGEWEKTAKEVVKLQKEWNEIGFAAKKENNKIYKKFHALCDVFFDRKREFFSHEKTEQDNNLKLKQELCERAETLKESTEWKVATEELILLQKQWKEIGAVPAKHREPIWKRFRAACDYFFEQKSKHFSSIESEHINNSEEKQKIIRQIRDFVHSGNREKDFAQLKEWQRQWNETGFVPIERKKNIQEEYREAITSQLDMLKLDKKDRDLLLYRGKIERIANDKSHGKIESERDKLMRKYQQLQTDLVVWENNIGFFSKTKSSAGMVANVQQKIEQGRIELKELKEKIKLIERLSTEND
ncbi:MAG: DUF349 domain-containing protein [Bacteroidales bacterium]|jgi:hypothetical protein|nr:DUF349 domain-containing protein [Bacteroidales bacterium]